MRVVVTGMGVISPLGNSADEFYNNLIKANGISAITHFDTSDSKIKVAAPVTDFNLMTFSIKRSKKNGQVLPVCCCCRPDGCRESGFKLSDYDEFRCGVIVGSG